MNTSAPGTRPAAASTAKPAAAPRRAGADRIDLDTTVVTGNRELPKVLYIVPWKKPLPGDLAGRPGGGVLDEALAPIDRDVFRRQVSYDAQLAPKAESAGAALAATPAPTPAKPAAKATVRPAAKPAPKPAARPVPATARQRADDVAKGLALATETVEAISAGQLDVAARVLTGPADCEFNQRVAVQPVDGQPGHFTVTHQGKHYRMLPRETTTGAVRLEDPVNGIVWLQIPAKSMLMNARRGQRMVDGCMHAEQRAAVAGARAELPVEQAHLPVPREAAGLDACRVLEGGVPAHQAHEGVAPRGVEDEGATGFDLRYTGTMMPPDKDWREFTEVLSRRDLATLMSAAWG